VDSYFYKHNSGKRTKKKVDSLFSGVGNVLTQDTEKARVCCAFLIFENW